MPAPMPRPTLFNVKAKANTTDSFASIFNELSLSAFSGFFNMQSECLHIKESTIVHPPISINIMLPIIFDGIRSDRLKAILLKDIEIIVPARDIKDIKKLLTNPILIFFMPYDNPTAKLSVLADMANKNDDSIFIVPLHISLVYSYILFIIWSFGYHRYG